MDMKARQIHCQADQLKKKMKNHSSPSLESQGKPEQDSSERVVPLPSDIVKILPIEETEYSSGNRNESLKNIAAKDDSISMCKIRPSENDGVSLSESREKGEGTLASSEINGSNKHESNHKTECTS